MMINLNVFLRKIRNEKTFSLLIICGLSLAFCVAIPLVCNVSYHKSFDSFHPNQERIFNIYCNETYHGTKDTYGELPLAFGEYIQKLYPEVESMVRTKDVSDALISKDNNNAWKENVLWADSSFQNIFSLELLTGDKIQLLRQPDNVYISESLSKKIFGDLTATGKRIKINETEYAVSGIFKNYPLNSHQRFSVLAPLKRFIQNDEKYKWDNYEFLTYVKLKPNADYKKLENKLQAFIKDYWVPWVKEYQNLEYVFNVENAIKLQLIPVSDIHLHGSFISSFEKESNTSVVYVNLAIALALVLIAYFNLLGFTVSKGKKQLSQLTINRYLGASKNRLTGSFIYENIGYTFIAFTISLVITAIFWRVRPPILSQLANISITNYILPIVFILLLAGIICVFSGFIVGIIFSKISLNSNKGKTISYSNFWLNRIMLICQIATSIILLVSISVIFKQTKYISGFSLGIEPKNIVIINHANRARKLYKVFKEELKKSPFIKEVSCSNSYPFNWMSTESYTHANSPDITPYPFQYFRTDIGFQRVLNFNLTQGRWFSEEFSDDKNAIILNEAAAKVMGLKNPVGEEFFKTISPSQKYHVIGIINNFNFQSLHHRVEPLLLCPLSEDGWWSFIEISGATQDRKKLTDILKVTWNKITGNAYLDYTFLEDKMTLLYEKEQQTKYAVGILSLIAILISCFGLLGTVLNTITERTKEIGIRKVNGARVTEILIMLNNDFIKWVAIAFLIACPIAWYAMHQWLQNFAYKTELSWWVFALAGIVAVAVAIITVSWQSWRAATRNPVESLRYE